MSMFLELYLAIIALTYFEKPVTNPHMGFLTLPGESHSSWNSRSPFHTLLPPFASLQVPNICSAKVTLLLKQRKGNKFFMSK